MGGERERQHVQRVWPGRKEQEGRSWREMRLSSSVFFSPLLNFTSSFLFFFSLVLLLKTAESRALTYSWEGSRTEKNEEIGR